MERKRSRLEKYDYSQPGMYFVTVCSFRRKHLFGKVIDGKMHLNIWGEVVKEEWVKTASIRENVRLDHFVVMPNHMHGILHITGKRRRATACRGLTYENFGKPRKGSIPTIIRSYKSAVTKQMHQLGYLDKKVWHVSYYDRVIRSEKELFEIRKYIDENPKKLDLYLRSL